MKTAVVVISFFLFLSCNKDNKIDCFTSNGSDITLTRHLDAFNSISVRDNFEVNVFQSAESKVEVTGGKRIINNISSLIKNDTLVLVNQNTCNFVRGYNRKIKINVYTPKVAYVINEAVGNVYFDSEFVQDSISVRVINSGDLHLNGTFRVVKSTSSGNGDMYLKGKCEKLFVFTTGINFVDTKELSVSDFMLIHTVSIGDCYVNAEGTKQFDYTIQKTGNIYYSGTPGAIAGKYMAGATGKLIKQD